VSEATCDEVRELAPELALGIATGEQRARALVHMASCTECRTLVDELSRTADSMLLLAPAREPPVGFEAQAAARVRGTGKRRWVRWAAAIAAAAIVSSGITAAIILGSSRRDHDLAERYLRLLEGQGELVATQLRTSDGGPAGTVYAYQGPTNWIFVVVNAKSGSGEHQVVLVPKATAAVVAGKMRLVDGRGSWGSTTGFDLRDLRVQLLGPDGRPAFEATFKRLTR
jgi:hypothetical protein